MKPQYTHQDILCNIIAVVTVTERVSPTLMDLWGCQACDATLGAL